MVCGESCCYYYYWDDANRCGVKVDIWLWSRSVSDNYKWDYNMEAFVVAWEDVFGGNMLIAKALDRTSLPQLTFFAKAAFGLP